MSSVLNMLQEAGIDFTISDHEAVYTVADMALHMPEEYPVKNLLLKEEKGERCIFVIMKGDERLDTKRLQLDLKCKKLQFAKPDVLLQKLGVEPGSVSLFNLTFLGSTCIEIVLDERLLEQKKLGFHPSDNTKTIFISGPDIDTFIHSLGRDYKALAL